MLANQMIWDFELFPREQTQGDEQNLRSLTDWKRTGNFDEDDVLSEASQHTIFCSDLPSRGLTRAYIDISEPHVILIIRHDAQPKGEELLPGEALTIAATMITGLDRLGLDGYVYIPVLLFSFLGNLQGRILQAYFDGENLVIWKRRSTALGSLTMLEDRLMSLCNRWRVILCSTLKV